MTNPYQHSSQDPSGHPQQQPCAGDTPADAAVAPGLAHSHANPL